MQLTTFDLARLMDLSAVRTECDFAEVRELAAVAKKLQVACVFAMPCYTAELKHLLADAPLVATGGAVGFPSGAHAASIKAAEARQQVQAGADEIDMVINVGFLRSGRHDAVRDDIRAVVDASSGKPVKVILECHYLSDDQIRRGSELCIEAGAAWVKTGTGWAPTGATLHNVSLIKSVVGDRALIKAAGGVRDLDTLLEMYRRGVRRFGISATNGVKILEACAARPGGVVEVY